MRRLTELIALRNTHPAFDGNLRVDSTGGSSLRLSWTHGPAMCTLTVDVATGELDIDEEGGRP